jgi:hypothetical protein
MEAGDIQGGLATARRINNWALLVDIAKAQAKAGDLQAALATAAEIQKADSRAWALALIAEEQAKIGDVNMALAIAGRIGETYRRAYALTAIAEAQGKAMDSAGARKTLKAAFAAAQQIGDPPSRALELARLAAAII